MLYFLKCHRSGNEERSVIRIIAGTLLAIWLLLVLMGNGGFVHLLLLNGVGLWVVDAVSFYRSRVTQG